VWVLLCLVSFDLEPRNFQIDYTDRASPQCEFSNVWWVVTSSQRFLYMDYISRASSQCESSHASWGVILHKVFHSAYTDRVSHQHTLPQTYYGDTCSDIHSSPRASFLKTLHSLQSNFKYGWNSNKRHVLCNSLLGVLFVVIPAYHKCLSWHFSGLIYDIHFLHI
jgi:hypothetical protein